MNTKHHNRDGNGETEESKGELKTADSKEKEKRKKNCDNCESVNM